MVTVVVRLAACLLASETEEEQQMRLDDSGNGVTRDSILFFRDNRDQLGHIVAADVRFPGFGDPFDPFLMVLRDAAGNEMRLSGCTTGYAGEGPRASMQVLVEAGFPLEGARGVFTEPTLALSRDCRVETTRDRPPRVVEPPDSGRRTRAPLRAASFEREGR